LELPRVPSLNVEKIPEELKRRRQWICWKYDVDGKITKVPVAPWVTGDLRRVSVTDPNNCTDFDTAVEYSRKYAIGIGFCFFRGAKIVGVDLDKLEQLGEEAKRYIQLANSYSEYSPSGQGAHIYGYGELKKAIKKAGIEVYNDTRFFTVTGNHVEGTPTTLGNIQPLLDELVAKYGEKETVTVETKPVPERGWETYVNKLGYALQEIREKDKVLDEYLRGGLAGKPSQSEADMGALERLLFWGFERGEAVAILEYYRWRKKLLRRDYVEGMLKKLLPVKETAKPKPLPQNGALLPSGDFNIGGYTLGLVRKDVLVYNKDGKPVLSCKLHVLNAEKTKARLVELTGVSKEEVERKVAEFIFKAHITQRRKELDESGDEVVSNNAEEPKEEVFDEETKEKARLLLRDPAFFYKLGKVFEYGFFVPKVNKVRFVIQEERNKRLLGFLLMGAAKHGMTSIIKVLGEPGTAKDSMLRMWLKLLEPCLKAAERSYFTAATLRYSEELQGCDLLYIPDSPELTGEKGRHLRFMRADDGGLISEYALKDPDTGEMATKTVTLPVKAVATTSNAVTGDTALESGMWTLHTNGSSELTKEVKLEKLKFRAGKRQLFPEDELKIWQYAFWLMLNEEPMEELPKIPFAEKLADLLASERSESRRDPDKLCDLISIIAWARRLQKPKEKWAEADLVDLYIALQLGLDAITETISDLDVKEQQIFQAIKNAVGEDVTSRYIAEETGIPYKTCYRLLEKMIEKGFVTKDKKAGRNVYGIFKEKEPKTFLIGVDISQDSPDKLLEQVLSFVGDFSPSHNPTEKGCNLIDPITGQRLTFDFNDGKPIVKVEPCSVTYPPFQPDEKVRSVEKGEENVSISEKKPNGQTFQSMRSDLAFSKPNIKCPRPSEAPGGLLQCEFCAMQGEPIYFATKADLESHIKALHSGYPNSPETATTKSEWEGSYVIGPFTPDVAYHKTASTFQTFHEERKLDVKDVEQVLAFYWKPESYARVLDKLLADGVIDKKLYATAKLKFEWKGDTTREEIINKLVGFGLSEAEAEEVFESLAGVFIFWYEANGKALWKWCWGRKE
jgi:predicted transcriptional regulator